MTVIDWLLDSDPSICWQVMRDLVYAPADEVAAEHARACIGVHLGPDPHRQRRPTARPVASDVGVTAADRRRTGGPRSAY